MDQPWSYSRKVIFHHISSKGSVLLDLLQKVARSYVQAMDIEYRIRPEESLISAFQGCT
jgi:hypothetical protein